jgi:glutamyl-tRNA synthetase
MAQKVVTRFAPSPTGLLHGGNYRTAIFAYLFAKKMDGEYIVRIEDTDRERSKKEYEENIWETLEWLGLMPDKKFRQSEHTARHSEEIKKLLAEDKAYVSQETAGEGKRSSVIRFRNPKVAVTFTDSIRGPITTDTTDLGDFIIARSETEPVFHLAVVVDDADEGVTHVIRGEDHISNTPRQILLQEALGYKTPTYAHLPLVLGPDRSKLSKRRGAKALTEYRGEGYLPEAMINYLALLGWHPESNEELFSVEELIEIFDLARIQKGAGIFDETKLRWFNHEHLRRMADGEFAKRMKIFLESKGETVPENLMDMADLMRERYQTLGEAAEALKTGEFDFMGEISYPADLLLKGAKADASEVKKNLDEVAGLIESIAGELFTEEGVKEVIFPYATAVGRAQVLWPMRVALSGREKSPDPFTLANILGKEKTIERLNEAVSMLK